MPNIIECPICDAKYNITNVRDGVKLRCARCKKVVGTIMGGNLLPILEKIDARPAPEPVETKPPIRVPEKPPQVIQKPEPEVKPVVPDESVPAEPPVEQISRPSVREEPVETKAAQEEPVKEPETTPAAETVFFQDSAEKTEVEPDKLPPQEPESTPAVESPFVRRPSKKTAGRKKKIQPKEPEKAIESVQAFKAEEITEPGRAIKPKKTVEAAAETEPATATALMETPAEGQVKPREKPGFFLILAGIIGAAAIIMFIYILLALSQHNTETKTPGKTSDKGSVSASGG